MSITNFMENGSKMIKVHIVKKINSSNYIGGDDSKLVHIKQDSSNFGELQQNQSYSLIKPAKLDEQTIILNPKFKPSKITLMNLTTTEEEVNDIEKNLVIQQTDTDGETFETIDKKPANSKIDKITVKCLSTSRIIQTTYGEYRIAKIRDVENNKGDINLNKHSKNKMTVDQTYHLENIKISSYKNEDSQFRRLATLPTTLIRQISNIEEAKYSHIRLGDERASGTCIGLGTVFGYFGCSNCWKKVDPDSPFCTKCNASTDMKTMEFTAELYIEMEEEIVTAIAFKRHFVGKEILTIEGEEIEKFLEAEIVGTKLDIEYNEGDKEDKVSLVKIIKKHELKK